MGDNKYINMGKIKKIYFGTPYETLTNYKDIEEKHKDLQKYLRLKSNLEKYCEKKNESIECVDYKFDKPVLTDFEHFEFLLRHHCEDKCNHICWDYYHICCRTRF